MGTCVIYPLHFSGETNKLPEANIGMMWSMWARVYVAMHDLFAFHNFGIQHLKSYICLQTYTQHIEVDDNELYTCFTEKFQED